MDVCDFYYIDMQNNGKIETLTGELEDPERRQDCGEPVETDGQVDSAMPGRRHSAGRRLKIDARKTQVDELDWTTARHTGCPHSGRGPRMPPLSDPSQENS